MDSAPVTTLEGVKEATAAKLARLDIYTVTDLLFHLPFRYQDRTHLTLIRDLQPETEAFIQGKIVDTSIFYGRNRSLRLLVKDETGGVFVRFFHFTAAMQYAFRSGVSIRCFGSPRMSRKALELFHPECSFIDDKKPPPLPERLTPIYPLTTGISHRQMRKIIALALEKTHKEKMPELLPASTDAVLEPILRLSPIEALELLHNPVDKNVLTDNHPAQLRLAVEEICAYRLALLNAKKQRKTHAAHSLPAYPPQWREFLSRLPFSPTMDQKKCIDEIAADLAKERPMVRLLQGDVGCGKTLVAAYAALQAMAAGKQVALMAPTEILAEQHISQFTQWFSPLGYRISPLFGKMTARSKNDELQFIANGTSNIAVGTHALFQEKVVFKNLALIIIDEQHRFGVKQRQLLQEKAGAVLPHQLIMSATPIPRTLTQTVFIDMDISVIKEMPPGRIPCTTLLLSNKRREELINRIEHRIREGAQVYWVCVLIEESDLLTAAAAKNIEQELQESLPQISIGLIHGRMSGEEKQTRLRDFKAGDIQLLVATTVIEVGIDIPQANYMVIENAERLGLAQLHQLRGRVGRGGEASYCILMFRAPLGRVAKKRLELMRNCTDGFEIAEKDLELRGGGELLGTNQSGLLQWRIADMGMHRKLILHINTLTEELLQSPAAKQQQLIKRWFGRKSIYGMV